MLQDIKDLVYTYKRDLAAMEITSMRYVKAGDRMNQIYMIGSMDMLRIVRRTLKTLVKKNEGNNESI